ncbi:UDP-3-O-acyl-N-acetylglucosamine deacetylase [Methylobacterium cerastii]|uniref:UDP-3-O-acyl-N-acetylglucosamine deacetylase n=2 Tax=Methylobacterium TaxID=407 RepID=A0ABQ4QGM4_9HYPH|nr:UDP-3-O-acyl-N-acetylglucosamine deacetylase [Methylobacterium cerastii]GJD44388.1 UDP-3-O-acyl-N-acetylglucosamine deacetylase [Methylobacterium cerastii]
MQRQPPPDPMPPAFPSERSAPDLVSTPGGPFRATLGAAFSLSGRGLHTGRRATVRVGPAPPGHGVVFRRTLRDGRTVDVPASWSLRERQPLCTALRSPEGPLIRTVEHLLAALSAEGVDEALVEIDAEELPIFDGSAVPWCRAIRAAGRIENGAPRRTIRMLRTVQVEDGRRTLRIEPHDGLHVSAHLALAHFGPLDWSGTITPDVFLSEIAPARSFGRYWRAMLGRAYGFVTRKPFLQGCGVRSAAMIVRGRILGGMRVADEPVRHRVLDLVGDLALAGHPIRGRLIAAHTGHELNHALVARLLAEPDAWELV